MQIAKHRHPKNDEAITLTGQKKAGFLVYILIHEIQVQIVQVHSHSQLSQKCINWQDGDSGLEDVFIA